MSLPFAWALAEAVRRGETSALEVVEAALARTDPLIGPDGLGAFLSLDARSARSLAAQVDARVRAGESLPLAGVPFAVKDNIAVQGQPLRCASLACPESPSASSAVAVQRLVAAGAIPLGRTNMDELAMGSSTERSAFFPCLNPWDPDRVPGGSSGGSAVAVAVGAVPLALGSDTGGSLRQPAAFCGVTALLPSPGRVPTEGLVPLAPSMDAIGPMARCMRDLGLAFSALASAAADERPLPEHPRVGIVLEALGRSLDPALRRALDQGFAALEGAGARLRPVSLPGLRRALGVYQDLCAAELALHLKPHPRHGEEVRRRLARGVSLRTPTGEPGYRKASEERAHLRAELLGLLEQHEVLALPVATGVAFRLGERLDEPEAMAASDGLAVLASLAGLPALVVPLGLADLGLGDKMPAALQLLGRPGGERQLLALGEKLEARFPPMDPPRPKLWGRSW